MPIDRTAYNTLVDDNGTGNGTIWNKNQIKNVLLDPIDTAIASAGSSGSIGLPLSYTPVLTPFGGTFSAHSGEQALYTIIGKLFFFTFYATWTISGSAVFKITMSLPAGITLRTNYQHGGTFSLTPAFSGFVQVPDSTAGTIVNLIHDASGSPTTFPSGAATLFGSGCFFIA